MHPAARLLILPPLAALIYLRDPAVFDAPRLWAEEGSNYFHSAMHHGLWQGLTNVTAAGHNPYLHLVPQLATWAAANFVPVELAPAVTTSAWVLIVLGVVAVALYGRARLLDTPQRRLLALAAPLLAVSNAENWANTLGAHFWADYAMLLLVLEGERVTGKRRAIGLIAFTFLGVLSPTSWVLLPATLALCVHRWRPHRAYLMSLAAVVTAHVTMSMLFFPPSVRRPAAVPEAVHLAVSKLVIWPVLGPGVADPYVEFVLSLDARSFQVLGYVLAVPLAGLVVAFLRASRQDPTTVALLWTHLAATAGFLIFGLHVGRDLLPLLFGARYAWLPNALLILMVGYQVDLGELRRRRPRQLLLSAVFGAMLFVGAAEYRYSERIVGAIHGPDWRSEVERYEREPSYTTLGIWPIGWTVSLPPQNPAR